MHPVGLLERLAQRTGHGIKHKRVATALADRDPGTRRIDRDRIDGSRAGKWQRVHDRQVVGIEQRRFVVARHDDQKLAVATPIERLCTGTAGTTELLAGLQIPDRQRTPDDCQAIARRREPKPAYPVIRSLQLVHDLAIGDVENHNVAAIAARCEPLAIWREAQRVALAADLEQFALNLQGRLRLGLLA